MSTLTKLKLILKECEELDEKDLKKFRKILWLALHSADQKLEETSLKPGDRCPHCQSSNVKRHGSKPIRRIYCLDCEKAYSTERQTLYYRRRNRDKIIDLIVAIHTTDKSAPEIIQHLNISTKTFYQWRKLILSVFPQLENKFTNRR